MAVVKNWKIIEGCVTGEVYGSPKLKDGYLIRTSHIQRLIELDNGVKIAITSSGSQYYLFPELQA